MRVRRYNDQGGVDGQTKWELEELALLEREGPEFRVSEQACLTEEKIILVHIWVCRTGNAATKSGPPEDKIFGPNARRRLDVI